MKKRLLATVTAVAIGLTVSATSVASADDRNGMEKISSILSSLVSNGTITQSQADAITKAAQAAAEVTKGAMKENRAKLDSIITSTLGISLESLKTRLKAGESLAAIAGDKKDALIAALIAELNKQIEAALSAGKITSNQATSLKAKTAERVTKMVNNVKGFDKKGYGHSKGQKLDRSSLTSSKIA